VRAKHRGPNQICWTSCCFQCHEGCRRKERPIRGDDARETEEIKYICENRDEWEKDLGFHHSGPVGRPKKNSRELGKWRYLEKIVEETREGVTRAGGVPGSVCAGGFVMIVLGCCLAAGLLFEGGNAEGPASFLNPLQLGPAAELGFGAAYPKREEF